MVRILRSVVTSLFLLVPRLAHTAPEAAPDWADISAIFVDRCIMCHSEQGAARGLRLDSYDSAIKGSTNGVVLVPGDAARSELIRRLRGESLPRMPFLSYPLPPDQIDLIIRWIEAGLPEISGR